MSFEPSAAADVEPVDDELPGRSYTTAPLENLYRRRVDGNQDLFVVVSDYHNRRGTGKSVLSVLLGERFDRTDEGLTIGKCTLDAHRLASMYTEHPRGSAIVLDEAEAGANKYEAGTTVNKELRKKVSMGRVEEKYVIMNLPNAGEIDRDLLQLADVWILVTRRGRAIVHLLANNPYEGRLLTPKSEYITWDDIPEGSRLRGVYDELTEEKETHLRGEEGTQEVFTKRELEERVEQARKQAAREKRDEIIKRSKRLKDMHALNWSDVAMLFDVSQQRVGQIANED